jgi:hypothetical protein
LEFKEKEGRDAVGQADEGQGRMTRMPQLLEERCDTPFSGNQLQFQIRLLGYEREQADIPRANDYDIHVIHRPWVITLIKKNAPPHYRR